MVEDVWLINKGIYVFYFLNCNKNHKLWDDNQDFHPFGFLIDSSGPGNKNCNCNKSVQMKVLS